jgi:hypothetical protein
MWGDIIRFINNAFLCPGIYRKDYQNCILSELRSRDRESLPGGIFLEKFNQNLIIIWYGLCIICKPIDFVATFWYYVVTVKYALYEQN